MSGAAGCAESTAYRDEAAETGAHSTSRGQVAIGPANDAHACAHGSLPDGVIIDDGHSERVDLVQRVGDRLLSSTRRRWILWDIPTGTQVATGAYASANASPWPSDIDPAELAGSTLLAPLEDDAFELRHVDDGQVFATIQTGGGERTTGLYLDGRHVFSVDDTKLRAWTLEGRLLFERASKHRRARVFATSTTLQIADGTSQRGHRAVETVDLAGKTVNEAAHQGEFIAWFGDGRHFVTEALEAHRVYSLEGQEVLVVPHRFGDLFASSPLVFRSLAGHGDFLWVHERFVQDDESGKTVTKLLVYRLNNPEPIAVHDLEGKSLVSAEGGFAIVTAGEAFSMIQRFDARERDLLVTEHSVPTEDGAADWVRKSFDQSYVSVDAVPAPRCGGVRRIAASASGRVAVGMGDGAVRFFETRGETGPPTLPLGLGSALDLSPDGRRLFVHKPLQVFELPEGHILHTWTTQSPITGVYYEQPTIVSADGQHVARRLCQPSRTLGLSGAGWCYLEVTTGSGALLSRTSTHYPMEPHVAFSPSGRRVAFWENGRQNGQTTSIVEDGKIIAKLAGALQGWLDDERLLVTRAGPQVLVVDLADKVVAAPSFKSFVGLSEAVDGAHVLTRDTLYRVSDGAIVVREAGASSAVVAHDEVIFMTDGRVTRRRFR